MRKGFFPLIFISVFFSSTMLFAGGGGYGAYVITRDKVIPAICDAAEYTYENLPSRAACKSALDTVMNTLADASEDIYTFTVDTAAPALANTPAAVSPYTVSPVAYFVQTELIDPSKRILNEAVYPTYDYISGDFAGDVKSLYGSVTEGVGSVVESVSESVAYYAMPVAIASALSLFSHFASQALQRTVYGTPTAIPCTPPVAFVSGSSSASAVVDCTACGLDLVFFKANFFEETVLCERCKAAAWNLAEF